MSYGDKKSVMASATIKDQIQVKKFGSNVEHWRPLTFINDLISSFFKSRNIPSDNVDFIEIGGYNSYISIGTYMIEITTVGTYTLPLLSSISPNTPFLNVKNNSGGKCVISVSGSDLIEDETEQLIANGDAYTFYMTPTQYRIT